MTWEQSKGEFLESDVVEWVEAIWSPNKSKRKKARPWGKQKVIAQIVARRRRVFKAGRAEISRNRKRHRV